jgi:transcriptional regulator with XRE-family HTH domain
MPRNVEEIIRKLTPAQRKRVERRAAELMAEEMTLQQLRHARKLTQARLAKSLHIGQEGISKLEQRTDLLISTLRSCVKGMGGELHLIAEFPDRPPVELSGFSAMENERRKKDEEVRAGE